MLGDSLMSDQLDPSAVSYAEIAIALLIPLFAEWQPSADEVAALISSSETFAATQGRLPVIAEQQNIWFAVGMPDSPFATLDASSAEEETEG